jgi:hypothetical protein
MVASSAPPHVAAAICLLLLACDNGTSTHSESSGSDRLRTVEHGSLSRVNTPVWRLDTVPLLRIGASAASGGPQLVNVKSVALSPDNYIVAADVRTQSLFVFDTLGALVRMWGGRRADGPGEFENIVRAIPLARDTLLAVEYSAVTTINRFSIHGGFLDRVVWTGDTLRSFVGSRRDERVEVSFLSNGSFLIERGSFDMPGTLTAVRDTAAYSWFDRNGRAIMELGRWPGELLLRMRSDGGGGSAVTIPAAPATVFAADPLDRRICAGDQQQARIVCVNRDSARLVISWSPEPPPVPAAAVAEFQRDALQMFGGDATSRKDLRVLLDKLDLQRTRRVFGQIMLDSDLNLWIQIPGLRITGFEGLSFAIFDKVGSYVARAALPVTGLDQIHGGRGYGISYDDDGVPYVTVFRILK